MTKSYWKTETSLAHRERLERPSWGQVLRQVATAALGVALWGVLLVGYLYLTGDSKSGAAAVPPATAVAAATAIAPVPTSTPTASPTVAPTPTDSPTPTQPPSPSPTSASAATTATQAPDSGTETPTPLPATDTPPPPTDTPTPAPTATEPPPTATPTMAATQASQLSFVNDVLPILQNRCVKCHGGEETNEGLVLKSYADVLAGSFNGPVVEPGNAEESFLVKQIVSGEMPKRGPRLLPGEIRFIVEWINAGAPDN